MKATNQNLKIRNLLRFCTICEKKLQITVNPDKTYKGGHFFGKIEVVKRKRPNIGNAIIAMPVRNFYFFSI